MIFKRMIATALMLSISLSTVVFSYNHNVFVDVEEFSGASIGTNWEVTCAEGNIAEINTENQNYRLNKYIDNSGVRLSYVLPEAISSGKLAIEFSFYMNGTDSKAIQIKGINNSGTDIFLYRLTQGKRTSIRNEVSGYTDLSSDILSKGKKHDFKTVIDFDAENNNISTFINSTESSVKKGYQQAANSIELKKLSFYIPTASEYTGGGIVIDDFKIYTENSDSKGLLNSYLNLKLENSTEVVGDILLPTSDKLNGTTIEWISSKQELITDKGIVTRPYYKDENVILTALISKNGFTLKKEFNVTVLKSNINDEKLNAGFEDVTQITPGTNYWSGDKMPKVWKNPNKVNTPDSVKFTAMIDEEITHSGNYSLRLGSDTEPARIMVSQTVNGLSPEKTYRLSGYIKTENYTPSSLDSIGPVIQALVSGSSNYYAATSVESNSDWTYVENIFTPGADSIRIDCNFVMGSGFAWFDDIKLEEYTPVRSVTLNKQYLVMEPEEKEILSAKLHPISRDEAEIIWSSTNEDIATVDQNGVVKAVGIKRGRAIISATVTENICFPSTGGKKVIPQLVEGVCIVEVNNPIYDTKVALINLDKTQISLVKGGKGEEITASVKPMGAINRSVAWRSSDESVAKVTDGMVIPVGVGRATVYAEADGVSEGCTVIVTDDANIPTFKNIKYVTTANFDASVSASGYPKLLFDMTDIKRIRETSQHPLYINAYHTMEETAEKYLGKSYRVHPRTASGGRVLNKRVCELAMVGYINKDMRYINKAVEYMMNSSDEYNAEDYKNMNGDIALGDAAHAYAVGYDWLYPFMTDAQRNQIKEEMNYLIDELYALLNTDSTDEIPAVSSNHASVSAGGMGLASLILGDRKDAEELAKKITIEYYKTSTDPEGFSFEGISYYSYGLLGAATFNAALERTNGIDMLKMVPSYKNTLDAITYFTKPDGGSYVAIGDSSYSVAPAGGIMYLISKYNNKTALWNYLRLTGDEGDRSYGGGDDYLGSSIPYILIFADTDIIPQKPDNFLNGKKYDSGFVSMRDGWENGNSFLTFTSSAVPHRGHNQRDENSFTFDAFGESFLIDPGYDPTETISHNSLLINGSGQSVPGNKYDVYGNIDDCILYDTIGYIKGDASDTYPLQPEVSSVLREVLYRGGSNPYIVLRDYIEMPEDVDANIQVLFQTDLDNKVVINSDSDEIKIIGTQNGAVMKITNPFDKNTIMRNGNYNGRTITGGRGEYVVSEYSKTIEAITNTKGNTNIVSLILTSANGEFPEVEVHGTAVNGLIKLKFADGRIDYITFSDEDIKATSVKGQLKDDSDSSYAYVEIGPSVNETEEICVIYSAEYDGKMLTNVKTDDFTFSGTESKHTLPISNQNGQISLYFWKKNGLKPVFDKINLK